VRSSSDAGILSQLLGLHYYHQPLLLDATWGRGAIWRGCPYQPTTRFDARPMPGVDVIGEWTQLPALFGPGAFQAIVWDPPHQTDGGNSALLGSCAAAKGAPGGWADAYGTAGANVRGFDNITHLYADFLEAARAILQPEVGMLLCKIADMVHAQEQQLQAVDFVLAARSAGWTVCEMVPKMRRPGPTDPRWRRQLHVRKAWSYWICAHPGPRCPAVGVALVRPCEGCGRDFHAGRRHARTCSDACRQRLSYRKNLTVSRSTVQRKSVRKTGS
jgi:hypothetical protein